MPENNFQVDEHGFAHLRRPDLEMSTHKRKLAALPEGKRVAVIRTSDRLAFRSCRRKWGWSSHLRGNLGPKQNAAPLWFGSGFHFAMEDFHGYNLFKDPVAAFDAYVKATRKHDPARLPDDWEMHVDLGHKMISYYELWLERRKNVIPQTFYVDGVPQVEINFRVNIPVSDQILQRSGYDQVVYSGTIDRVVVDPRYDMLWLLDYKTAKQFSVGHYMTDDQITAYCWAASCIYQRPVGGMIYAQHLKHPIEGSRVLKSGALSVSKNMRTSHILYRNALIDMYGAVKNSPAKNIEYLNSLAKQEDERRDTFIRHDWVHRNEHQIQAQGVKILLEMEDMLNPDLPLYPNPSRECQTFCSFMSPCVSLDDGSDWEYELQNDFEQRPAVYDPWRELLILPEAEKPKQERKAWDDV